MLKICKGCRKTFNIKPSKYEKRVYCTQECMAEDYRTRYKGETNPNYRNATEKRCLHCGAIFTRGSSSHRVYCSEECHRSSPTAHENRSIAAKRRYNPDAYPPPPSVEEKPKQEEPILVDQIKQAYLWRGVPVQRAVRKGKCKPKSKKLRCRRCDRPFAKIRDNQRYCEACIKLTRACEQCEKSFITHRKTGTPRFCSESCARKYCGTQKRGELSNLWRGGATDEKDILRASSEYRKWRRQVFKRDNHICQMCFQKGGKLHAHHIKMLMGHFDLAFDVTNGITLCRKCHLSIRQREELYEEQFYAITRPRREELA